MVERIYQIDWLDWFSKFFGCFPPLLYIIFVFFSVKVSFDLYINLSRPQQNSVICYLQINPRKQPMFREVATWTLTKRRLSNERRNSYWWRVTTQILVVLLIGWNEFLSGFNQSEALPTSGWWSFIRMEFLRLLLRRRFARAQVATSRDVGCFIRLPTILCVAALRFSTRSRAFLAVARRWWIGTGSFPHSHATTTSLVTRTRITPGRPVTIHTWINTNRQTETSYNKQWDR